MVHDFWPQQDGSYRLRDGYTLYATGLQAGLPIHSVVSVTGPAPSFTPLVVFWQGKVPYVIDQAMNVVTTPTIRGTAIQSSSRFSYFYTNGHLHAFNGTDAKWFDGTAWRDIGLPSLTSAQAAAVIMQPGLEAITPTQATAVVMTAASGGAWIGPATVNCWLAFFDTATNILAASALSLGSGPLSIAAGQKINLTNLPSSGITTAVALLAFQNGAPALGLPGAVFAASGFKTLASVSVDGATVTLKIVAHGWSTGAVIAFNNSNGPAGFSDGPFAVTVIDADHVAFTTPRAQLYTGVLAGTAIFALISVPNGTTSGSISQTVGASAQGISFDVNGGNMFPYANDPTQISGLAASSIGGSQPGYLFFGSIYNLVTGHVGNRTQLGLRLNNTATLASILLTGLPTFTDSEWVLLLGRTGDGAEIPYAIIDNNANWQFAPNDQTTLTLLPYGIDGNSELPSRNYPPPGTLDSNYQYSLLPGGAAQNPPIIGTFVNVWVESDHCCGTLAGSPTIYRSGSALDFREGVFVGLPEQSWDPGDIETFPTGSPVVAGHSYQQESWCFTRQDCAILMELAGETSWQGPYNIGGAGQHAWTRGWQNLPFWVTGEKELATVSLGGWQQLAGTTSSANAGPVIISSEYEAALLSKIGDAYLSQTEVSYIRQPLKMVEVLRIKCFDANGNPFTIIHDFNMRDERSPYGQAYQETFLGELGTAFTQATIRDQNEKSQVICGGADGNLYLLYSGGNDNGVEFLARALRLVNLGPQRTAVKFLEWYGDGKAHWYISRKLNTPFNVEQMTDLCQEAPQEVQGEEGDNRWIVDIPTPEMVHAYILLQLTSHSTDGSSDLNSPPHMPVESYGRVWLVAPQLGASRPR
jgi:hypothetical protein